MQNTKQVLNGDNKDIFKRKREFYLDEDLVDKIDSIEYGAQVNTIEEIEVNGVPVEPDASKTVHLNIPRVIDALTSDSSTDALSARMGKYLYSLYQQTGVLYRYRGSVATFDDLPESGNQQGDVYNILDTGMNYAWTGTERDALGGSIYTAGYNIEISDDNVISTKRQPDHYLGHWNCIQGQSSDFLEEVPYDYNAGDYYIVNKTADMSWTKRIEMLLGEYHIPSFEEAIDLFTTIGDLIPNQQNNQKKSNESTKSNGLRGNESVPDYIFNGFQTIFNLPNQLGAFNNLTILQVPEGQGGWGFRLQDGFVIFTGEQGDYSFVPVSSINNASEFSFVTNETMFPVRAFKDEPVIPDSSWTIVYDFEDTSGIEGTGVFKNTSLGLVTCIIPVFDEDQGVFTNELKYYTFKDKNEGATTVGGKGSVFQRGNCNPITINDSYEFNDASIDFTNVSPSTYSSNKIDYQLGNYSNYDNAWGYESNTITDKRGPCPEGFHLPEYDNRNKLEQALVAYHCYYTRSGSFIVEEDSMTTLSFVSYAIPILGDKNIMDENGYRMGYVLPIKDTVVDPDLNAGWELICTTLGGGTPSQQEEKIVSVIGYSIYHNATLGLFSLVAHYSNNTSNTVMTCADKFLGATEIADPFGDYLERGSVTLTKAKYGNTYQWGNNYAFDMLTGPIELMIGALLSSESSPKSSGPIPVTPVAENIIREKTPFAYNGNIILYLSGSGGGGGGSSMKNISTKSGEEQVQLGSSSIYALNQHLWDTTEVQYNLRPKGSEYVEVPLTDSEIEEERVDINDIYLYDGTRWILMGNHIVPHVFVTQAEYDAISDKKYSNGTLYLFVDKHPGDAEDCSNLQEYEDFPNDNTGIPRSGNTKLKPIDYRNAVEYVNEVCNELNRCAVPYFEKFELSQHLSSLEKSQAVEYLYLGEWKYTEEASKSMDFEPREVFDGSTGYTYRIKVSTTTHVWESEAIEPGGEENYDQ